MDGFFGIGTMELMLVAVIALVVLGPERLPSTLRSIAKFIRQLRAIYNELTSQFSDEFKILEDINPQKLLQELGDELIGEEASKTQPTTGKGTATKPAGAKAASTNATKPSVPKPATKPATATKSTAPKSAAVKSVPEKSSTGQATKPNETNPAPSTAVGTTVAEDVELEPALSEVVASNDNAKQEQELQQY